VSTTTPDADLRCPQCAAHVRAGSDWCTLCYADLRPAPAPAPEPPAALEPVTAAAPEPELEAEPVPVAADAPAEEDAAPVAPRRGKHAKHAARPSTAETEALAAQLLAQLAVEESGSPLGRYSSLMDTTGKKVALMVGGAVVVTLLVFAFMALVGAFL
jgi:hypothetical protein